MTQSTRRVNKAIRIFFKSWTIAKNLVDRFEIALRAERTKVMRMLGAKENIKSFVAMSKEYRKSLQEFFDANIITVVSSVMDKVRRDGLLLRADISHLEVE